MHAIGRHYAGAQVKAMYSMKRVVGTEFGGQIFSIPLLTGTTATLNYPLKFDVHIKVADYMSVH